MVTIATGLYLVSAVSRVKAVPGVELEHVPNLPHSTAAKTAVAWDLVMKTRIVTLMSFVQVSGMYSGFCTSGKRTRGNMHGRTVVVPYLTVAETTCCD